MANLKCTECGCTIPPDLSKCPKCGHKQESTGFTAKTSGDGGITMGRTGYSIKCKIHGRIHITASVASPPTRCPFC